MVNGIKCPQCGKVAFVDDEVLDTYEIDNGFVWDCISYCFDCRTRFTYKKVFKFADYEDIKVYNGGEIIHYD